MGELTDLAHCRRGVIARSQFCRSGQQDDARQALSDGVVNLSGQTPSLFKRAPFPFGNSEPASGFLEVHHELACALMFSGQGTIGER